MAVSKDHPWSAMPRATVLTGGEGTPTPTDAATRAQRLARAALELTAAEAVGDVVRIVTEAARDVVGSHQATASRLVAGWSDAHSYISLSEKYAAWRDFDQAPVGRGVPNAVLRDARPVRLGGAELLAHPDFRALQDAPGHPPLPDWMGVPLMSATGGVLGIVQLSDKADGTPFDSEDEAMVVQLAQVASAAIERLELMEAERRQARRAEAVQRVGRAIMARLELQDIVQTATDAATELVGAHFGAFFYNVVDERGQSCTLFRISGAPRSAFEGFGMPGNTAIFAPTFQGEGVVRIDDVTLDPRYGRMPPHHGLPQGHLPVRSYLAVPVILSDGAVAGGLFFGHPHAGRFGAGDEQVAVDVAAQAAIAMENARLYGAARRAFEERDRVARVLQASLLPPHLPTIEGLEVAARYRAGGADVGGDFYDIFPVEPGVWGFVVGDVCGRGPEAAARTALTRYTVRSVATAVPRAPAEVLALLNQALLADDPAGRFCTAVVGRVALPADGGDRVTLELASGGHPPAVIARAGGTVEELTASGPILGVVPEVAFVAQTTTLAPGDVLVLYTDGLVEARAHGTFFGAERVAELAAASRTAGAAAVAAALDGAVAAFGAEGTADDIAILSLGVPEPGGG